MSLRIWLPLNGDLRNQGLDDVTVTSGTPNFKNIGKISSQSIDLSKKVVFNCPSLSGLTSFSIAFWAKVNSDSNLSANWVDVLSFVDEKSDKSGTGVLRWETCYAGTNYTNWGISSHDNSAYNISSLASFQAVNKNTWHHIAMTVDLENNMVKEYHNGILKVTSTCNGGHLTGVFHIGENNAINGEMNDLRIYDHALSAKEVSELAKGLVLHYRLADPYIESSKNLCTVTRSGEATDSTWGGHVTQWKFYDSTNDPVPFKEGLKAEIVYGENGATGGGAGKYICVVTVSPSTTYTYSCYIKASDDFEYTHQNFLYIYENTASGSGVTQFGCFNKERMECIGNGWYRIWGSFTTQSTTERVSLYNYTYPSKTVNYWFGGWQIEQKDHVTPFIKPNGERDDTTVWDCSGFGYNGIATNISWDSNTARYTGSYLFNGNNSQVKGHMDTLANFFHNDFTIAFWIYDDDKSNRSIYIGNYQVDGAGNGIGIEKTTGAGLRMWWYGNPDYYPSGFTIPDKEWTHIAIAKSSSEVKFYKNGSLINTYTYSLPNSMLAAGTSICFGVDNRTGEGGVAFKGNMSDVRFYASVLSADDILALYNLGGSLDSNGTFHTYEYVEV